MNKFFQWLNNTSEQTVSAKDRETFDQLNTLWQLSAQADIPRPPDIEDDWIRLQQSIERTEQQKTITIRRPKRQYSFRPAFVTAFIGALFIAIGYLIYDYNSPIKYQTNRQQVVNITLPDNSEIMLNSESLLRFSKKFNRNSRRVMLTGEAYFKIQKSKFPFIIETDIARVEVLGTEFNVRLRNDQLEVAVNEGHVEIEATVGEKDSSIILSKGEYSTCYKSSFPKKPQAIHFKQYPGWIHNQLTCFETKVKYICEEIERRYNVSIQIENKDIENVTLTGLFEIEHLDSLMTSLCHIIQKDYKYEDQTIIIF